MFYNIFVRLSGQMPAANGIRVFNAAQITYKRAFSKYQQTGKMG
jgi:hypothetical protein